MFLAAAALGSGLAEAFSSGIVAANLAGFASNVPLQPFQQNPIVFPM